MNHTISLCATLTKKRSKPTQKPSVFVRGSSRWFVVFQGVFLGFRGQPSRGPTGSILSGQGPFGGVHGVWPLFELPEASMGWSFSSDPSIWPPSGQPNGKSFVVPPSLPAGPTTLVRSRQVARGWVCRARGIVVGRCEQWWVAQGGRQDIEQVVEGCGATCGKAVHW